MKKKLFSAICALMIVLSQCGTVFAAEDLEENTNIADEAVSEKVSEEAETVLKGSSAAEETAFAEEDSREATLLFPCDASGEAEITEDTENTEEKDDETDPYEEEEKGGIFLMGAAALDMSYRYKTSKYGEADAYSAVKSFDFSEDKLTYNVFLPDNTQYAYLNLALPGGAEAEVYTINGENEDLLGYAEMSLTSTYQYKMKNPVLTETIGGTDYYIIPVKNEYSAISVSYTKDSETKEYRVNFFAKQPRLTAFTQYADANISFVGGAAANNDNGTVIDSAADSTVIRALSNISKKLVGSSVFMLPISKMKAANSWFIKNKNSDMFAFSADHAGTVYVMTYAANSANFNADNGWQTVNNATQATGVTISSNSSTARTKNDYTNTDYFAGMYGWKCIKDSDSFSGANKNRVNRLTGTLSTSYIDSNSTKTLKYVYSKDFAAGDTVAIPVPAEMATGWQGMAVLVAWDAQPDESVISLTEDDIPGNAVFRILYSEDNGAYTKILKYDDNNSYTVNFENNTEFAYIKLRLPDGTSAVVETDAKVIAETSGYYLVPITGGSETVRVTYENEQGDKTVYTVTFTSPQYDSAVAMQYAGDGKVSFISGAALASDGCILSTEYNLVDKIEIKLTASAGLLGASVFVLPLEEMRKAGSWTFTHPDEDMFSFVPDADGTVYVITDGSAAFNSEYELLWDQESGQKGTLQTVKTDLASGKTKSETVTMNYVYSYGFVSGEEVAIPVPELENWKGNMAVAVKWN